MYDEIFEDFNTIKEHYERNGNHQFEESAVFELLESLYPTHGSAQAVQIIIDMLDAQWIRDTKKKSNNPHPEISSSEKSSVEDQDDSDIIEIEVPKKVHPIVDLTENSTESDVTVIVEKSENKSTAGNKETNSDSNMDNNDSEASCHEIHSLSDSEASKNLNEDSNLFFDEIFESNHNDFLNYLNIIDQQIEASRSIVRQEQSYNDSVDASEILEENNNDPNNNFDEETANANNLPNNNLNTPRFGQLDIGTSFSGHGLVDSTATPGCSKEVESSFDMNDLNNPPPRRNLLLDTAFNPVPGCSKDLDISQNIQPRKATDESVEKDINCIQEIIPWAAPHKIRSLLVKHIDLPDRKQLTLLKLMKEDSVEFKPTVKRKSNSNIQESESKIRKVDSMHEMEDSLDEIPNHHLDSIFFNESSNDSQSSKNSKCIESTPQMNKNLQTSNNVEFPNIPLRKNWPDFDSSLNSSLNIVNSSIQAFSSTADRAIKKERNETIVSGLLKEQEQSKMLNGQKSGEKSISMPSTSSSKIHPPKESFLTDRNVIRFPWPQSNDSSNLMISVDKIEKNIKKEANYILNKQKDIPVANDFSFPSRNISNPKKDSSVIKPPKLLLQNPMNNITSLSPSKSNIVRPAILKFKNNRQHSGKNIATIGHEQMHTNNLARQNDNPVKLSTISPSNRQHVSPPVFRVDVNQSEKDFSTIVKNIKENRLNSKNHKLLHDQASVNMAIKRAKIETIVKPPRQVQLQPSHNNSVPSLPINQMSATKVSTDVPDQSIYNKLRSIFPDVKSSYIKQICINPPSISNTNDKAYILNSLIEHLLSEGSNHLRPSQNVVDQLSVDSISIDEKYEYLLGIFPDADPTYIRDFVVKNPLEQDFEQFIQDKLESRDYPTKEQYMARIKITEQIKQYTTDFNIERFLELFPDPFKHFEDTTRKCVHQPIAVEFLKSLFVKNKVNTIFHFYKNCQYNLSLTAKELTSLGTDMQSKRRSAEMPTEDIPLLQEIAFIKNKKNIENHLNMLKNKEDQLFKELKEQNLLITCKCCYNDECMPTKSSECNEGHVFCHECIIRGTESTLADGESHVRCFTECQSEFSLATLQKVLPPTKFSALLKKRQTAEVIAAEVDGLVSCPFCHFASIPPPEDKVFKCLNPECMKETCKKCKELNHVPLKCDEVIKSDKARHLVEEKMTEALIRTCYKCKKQFYKEDGCNKMECICGALMCYLCGKPVKGYNHFNAQGGANTHLCPLWSDDRLLNAKSVIKVAEDVKKSLLKNHPNLKIDTDSLLPKLPPKTKGPHDDIPNANELPEHIMRIAKAGP